MKFDDENKYKEVLNIYLKIIVVMINFMNI